MFVYIVTLNNNVCKVFDSGEKAQEHLKKLYNECLEEMVVPFLEIDNFDFNEFEINDSYKKYVGKIQGFEVL